MAVPDSAIVTRLRAAGCVFAEDEARLLMSAAGTPAELDAMVGQRAAGLRQYRECVRVLEQELGVAPLDETTQLYAALKENRPPAPPEALTRPAAQARPAGPTVARL